MEQSKVEIQHHFKLYKPYGYLSQFQSNDRHQRNSKFLGMLYDFPPGTMAIGRLDKDSEGLLLVTTDGQISFAISNRTIEKEYYVQLDGVITDTAVSKLQQGVDISIEGVIYTTKSCDVRILKDEPKLPKRAKKIRDSRHGATSWISITITEGKFRQVRKMTSVVGFPTLRLVRVRIGNNHLDEMQPCEVIQVETLL